MLIFNLRSGTLTRVDNLTTATDSESYPTVRVNKYDDWPGTTIVARFVGGEDKDVYDVIVQNDICTVPGEIMTQKAFYISFKGISGSTIITTNQVKIKNAYSGFDLDAEEPATPTPDLITQLINSVAALRSMVGTPLVASTAAGMTDTSKIYVYTGSETGYTAGNWYYYDGSEWQSGGVYNSTAINTDTTLSVSGAAADSKTVGDSIGDLTQLNTTVKTSLVGAINEVGDEVSDLKSDLNRIKNIDEITGLRIYNWNLGSINTSTGENAKAPYFRIRSDFIKLPLTASLSNAKVLPCFYDENKNFLSGGNWLNTSTITINKAYSRYYVRLIAGNIDDSETSLDALSSLIKIEDYSPNTVENLTSSIESLTSSIENSGLKRSEDYAQNQGWLSANNTWNNVSNDWRHAAVPVKNGDVIKLKDGAVTGWVAFVRSYTTPVNGQSPDFSEVSGYTTRFALSANVEYTFTAPSDAVYMLISTTYGGTANVYPYITINGYDIMQSARTNISYALSNLPTLRKTKWFALGDSITQGYTSAGGSISSVTDKNYVYYVALYNSYDAVNYGVGGAGYNHNATVGDQLNARDKVDTINFSGCDLCTLAYGVNDWHYNVQIGTVNDDPSTGETMASNMKYCIEKILSDNPLCKIIVILPMNNSAFGTGNTKANNWGLGASFPVSGTLQNVIDVEKQICEYYGIEYIDQSKTSAVNRENIQALLSDGTHPIAEAYPIIGANLAKQINFA